MAGPGGVTGPVAVGAGPGLGAVAPGAGTPEGGGAVPGVGSDDDEHATPSSAQVRRTKEREEEDRPIQAVGNVTVTQA
jgi:hypothetical protein